MKKSIRWVGLMIVACLFIMMFFKNTEMKELAPGKPDERIELS